MGALRLKKTAGAGAILFLLMTGSIGFDPVVRSPISAEEFVAAIVAHRTPLLDLYLNQHFDPNARTVHDRSLVLAAALEEDWRTVRRLLDAGASLDLADENRLTPLMVVAKHGRIDLAREFVGQVTNIEASDRRGWTALHYAIASGNSEMVNLLLSIMPVLETGSDSLLQMAVDSGSPKLIGAVAERLTIKQDWTEGARRALALALALDDKDLIRLLLGKHAAAPAREGRTVPLLAYAIASHDTRLFNTLLTCGADPNTTLPREYDSDFVRMLPTRGLRDYITGDENITALMLASGLGHADFVEALLDAGADRNRATRRYKMLALDIAAETGQWRCTQILLGSGPPPERLHIEISLASQHVSLIKDGVSVFNSICSTGRDGYSTRRGDFVITNKERSHRSTIYKVEMPYFMRLSCLDFGMHEGVVPNHPASHGCIRLPADVARKFFSEIPVGTLVSVQ
jgi:ankyrin repeat protein